MSDLSDLSDLSDICAAKISRVGENSAQSVPIGKSARRTISVPIRTTALRRPHGQSGMTGYTKLALQYRQSTVRSGVKKQQRLTLLFFYFAPGEGYRCLTPAMQTALCVARRAYVPPSCHGAAHRAKTDGSRPA